MVGKVALFSTLQFSTDFILSFTFPLTGTCGIVSKESDSVLVWKCMRADNSVVREYSMNLQSLSFIECTRMN